MKSALYVYTFLLALTFFVVSCSGSPSPTSVDGVAGAIAPPTGGVPATSSAGSYGAASGSAYASAASNATSVDLGSGYRDVRTGTEVMEEFNCTNVQEVFVRFSDPGYVLENAVGLFVSYTGLPAGRKLLRVWWDYEGKPGEYQNFHIGEGEVHRDDDALFDYKAVIEHAYAGVTRPTDYRVRAEMILVDKTGNCARVRDVTVTPGGRTVGTTVLSNGSFETGDFTGWTAQDLSVPFFPLSVVGPGVSPGFGFFTSAPTEGAFAAVNGFDGNGPGNISLLQTITVQNTSDTLRFDYRAAWDMVTFGGSTQDRVFRVHIESTGGAVLATSTILTAPAATVNLDTGNLSGAVALGAFAGSTINVRFQWFVPENFTGPAFFQLDNVRVTP